MLGAPPAVPGPGGPPAARGAAPVVVAREISGAGFLRVSPQRPVADPAGVMRQIDLLDGKLTALSGRSGSPREGSTRPAIPR